MKKLLTFLFLIQITVIYGCSIHDVNIQEGDRITKTYDITDFAKLDLSHAFNVDVVVGKEASLKITAGENVHPYILVKNEGSTLILSLKKNLNNVGSIKVELTVKSLRSVDVSGACKVSVKGISTESFELDMSGACKGELSGKVTNLEVDLSGATNLDAKDLIAEKVEIDISGASNAKVYANKSLEAEASGASNIKFYGEPDNVDADVSGASNIKSK